MAKVAQLTLSLRSRPGVLAALVAEHRFKPGSRTWTQGTCSPASRCGPPAAAEVLGSRL